MVKRFKGMLGAEEDQELQQSMRTDEQRRSAERYEQVWQLSGRYKESYQPDVAGGLDRFRHRLRKEEQPATAPARRRRLGWLLAAAAAVLLFLVVWQPWADGPPTAFVFATAAGEQMTVTLPDGSRALLNERSRIVCLGDWNSDSLRALTLSGEGFFEVEARARQAFLIQTGKSELRVLGTAFNVRAYPEEPATEVSVESGIVAFTPAGRQQPLRLEKRHKGVWEHAGKLYLEPEAGLNARAWRTGLLQFRATPMREVVRDIDHYLGVRLELNKVALKECEFTFSDLDRDQLREAFDAMEVIFNAEIEQVGPDHYLLKGGNCAQ